MRSSPVRNLLFACIALAANAVTATPARAQIGGCTPNFYFHLSMAYAILRHNGLEIGKKDYLGVA